MDNNIIRTVLVIGDDVGRLAFLCRALGSHYPVLSASDKKEGLIITMRTCPNAIVVDVGKSGNPVDDQSSQELGEYSQARHVPVVTITSSESQERILPKNDGTTSPPSKVLTEESLTAYQLLKEIEKLIGDNPAKYCSGHCSRDMLPSRGNYTNKYVRARRGSKRPQASPTIIDRSLRPQQSNTTIRSIVLLHEGGVSVDNSP